MASIFTRIIQGEIPCYKIAENDRFFAFLDINPLNEGHTLVVPKQEVDYLFDMEPGDIGGIFKYSQEIAKAIRAAIPCERIGVAVIGLEVPHAHVHLCPINGMGDLNFSNPKKEFSREQFEATAERIRNHLA